MKILMLSIGFSPNVGGIETHFDDFLVAARKRGISTTVLTYQPITSKLSAPIFEKRNQVLVVRLPWFRGFFYKLVKNPVFEFLYLVPGLFLFTPIILLLIPDIQVIHAHGLIAGFVGVFWGKLFNKRTIISTHSIYHFPKQGLYKEFARWIFANANFSLGLSQQAVEEIKNLSIDSRKVDKFIYWIDLNCFKPSNKKLVKKKLGWSNKFIVLFVGRLVEVKGVRELLEAIPKIRKPAKVVVIGDGPLGEEVKREAFKNQSKLLFLGRVNNSELPNYYNSADVLIVPSTHEEGFGRVILEALACGTPVIGSERGAIPEAMDKTVGRFIDITPDRIARSINELMANKKELNRLSANTRRFAEKCYSEKNIEQIIRRLKDE